MQKYDFKEKSYWLTTKEYTPNDPLKGRVDVDVAVIGGGFTGLSTAYHLKKADHNLKIALLESQVLGYGGSGRNAGFVMTKIGMMHSMTATRFGKTKTVEAHQYAVQAVDYAQQLIQELNIDCDYEHTGFLWVATSEKYKKRLYNELEFIEKLGLKGIGLIDENELQGRVNSPLYVGGAWWEPRSGMLNPAKLAWAWKDIIASMGVEVFEQSSVNEIVKDGKKFCLETDAGKVYTDKVVLAANAWSHLFKKVKFKQSPIWTYIVLTEPLNENQLKEIGWNGRETIEDFRDLVHYYRLTADNRLLMGGRDVSLTWGKNMDMDVNEKIFEGLKRDVVETFPSLKGVQFTHQWGGPTSATMDLFPAMGYAGDKNMVYSLGLVGHGVSLSQLNGQTLADLTLEQDTDLTRMFFVNRRTIPVPPEPFRRISFQGIVSFMRWEDRKYDSIKS